MLCPKCHVPNKPGAKECDSCGVVFADIRSKGAPQIDRNCPWNDHGYACGKPGSMSDSQNGSGPWYCSDHYWKLKGQRSIVPDAPKMTYRDRWYAERGLTYVAPKVGNLQVPKFKHAPQREPGEDSAEDIGEIAA
jgi:hypothetical protein